VIEALSFSEWHSLRMLLLVMLLAKKKCQGAKMLSSSRRRDKRVARCRRLIEIDPRVFELKPQITREFTDVPSLALLE
jgi:hypothetical protein